MVAKINRGVSLYGALAYNWQKVDDRTARIISGNGMITDSANCPDMNMQNAIYGFRKYLLANKNTDKPILHISLNPSLDDNLSEKQLAMLADEYMRKMGYGSQPYIVFLHEDIERRHIHIVSTCVNERGEKIDDSYEWNRSMRACRELERKFGLQQVADKRRELLEPYLKKADYRDGDVKRQIGNIFKSVFSSYRFQSFGEYSALLSCFNIEAKQVKGEHEGTPYNGIVYAITDDSGRPVSVPVKSSLIGKRFGYEGIQKRIGYNARDYKAKKWQSKIANDVTFAKHGCRGDRDTFVSILALRGIDVVFRENDDGRIYGATFIDHRNKEVYNGSRLGKEFSANAFENLFNSNTDIPGLDGLNDGLRIGTHSNAVTDMGEAIQQAFGILSLDTNDPDPQEEALANRLLRKKKKKRRYRGLQ
ncbi:MAG: relaxase/mobilization nuclease domain-containing protein [Muribaculaceae bacterium]|uniref:Mobilization protein n=1 Tax=Duncaniella dubosii TaxID=2518971 RepID=A0A4V1D3M7_9BACT|nr:conjugal transfer protein MobB [Duncaniella dubosii]MBJ2191312.1 relaxase/mobilization nuclease domain-containing protein [Muribaculaceae bacterium]QCD43548.1 mobilization protein [Duncaniella dubosii]